MSEAEMIRDIRATIAGIRAREPLPVIVWDERDTTGDTPETYIESEPDREAFRFENGRWIRCD